MLCLEDLLVLLLELLSLLELLNRLQGLLSLHQAQHLSHRPSQRLVLVLLQVLPYSFRSAGKEAVSPDMKTIGMQLLNVEQNGLALPFEVISILLLAAMIGCIVIAMRQEKK